MLNVLKWNFFITKSDLVLSLSEVFLYLIAFVVCPTQDEENFLASLFVNLNDHFHCILTVDAWCKTMWIQEGNKRQADRELNYRNYSDLVQETISRNRSLNRKSNLFNDCTRPQSL